MTKAVAVFKSVIKTKSFWSLAAVVALAVGTPAGSAAVKMAETVTCAMMGGCV